MTAAAPITPFDHLAQSLRARAKAGPFSHEPPAAILWTDPGSEWRALVPAALEKLPELLALGAYDPDRRTGPAVWLRCVVDGAIDPPGLDRTRPPILYLPGVKRADLRAGEDCPAELKPLVELVYRGAAWHHPNSQDWRAAAFLRSGGPGLDIGADQSTLAALPGVLDQVAVTPIAQLPDRIAATYLHGLAGVDVARDILRWMGNPDATRSRMNDNAWRAFLAECRKVLKFDPETDADVSAGAKLGKGADPKWAPVWNRFAEAPEAFPGVADLLSRSRPAGELGLDTGRWPDLNDQDEESVRTTLAKLPNLSRAEARKKVARLEDQHGHRRNQVWAKLGRSPMAALLEPLAALAKATENAIGGETPDDAANAYAEHGWIADASAREALAMAAPRDEPLIANAVRRLIESWLDNSARAFQAAAERRPLPSAGGQTAISAGGDECVVFIDGLRYELAQRLSERLRKNGSRTDLGYRWAALPTVTATAKPAATPVASEVEGGRLGARFLPAMKKSGREARAKRLRDAMKSRGYQILNDEVVLEPMSADARGWLEFGKIDMHGHHHDAPAFARLVDAELESIAQRISALIAAGWRSVRVVTDHGWLLLPRGLPLVQLSMHLTESKWSRCAVIVAGAEPDAPMHPWHWNPAERFASPRGIACFSKRDEYAHGGVSLQECMIPDLRVEGAAAKAAAASIRGVSWRRYRCDVAVKARGGPLTADLRLGGPAGESVASSPKKLDSDGLASLILEDDAHANSPLVVVVIDRDGRVLAQRQTSKGGGK